MSYSLRPHGLQHARLPSPSPTPRAFSNSCPSQQCHPTISSSVVPFSSWFQTFPASGSFPVSQLFTSVAKVLEFQLQPQSFQWIFGLTSFKIDWLDSLNVQGSLSSVQFTQSCPTLCDPMDCSTQGFPVHHQLPEFIQAHVHWVSDAIQPSHPLSSPSSPALNLSQHQGLFKWVSSSYQVAKVLEFQLQHQSFQWTFRTDFL